MDSLSLVLLALAVSIDSLTVGLLYGARGIKLPWAAMLIVSLATGLLLSLAMGGGAWVATILPPEVANRLGAAILAGVGAWVTFQTWRSHRTPRPADQPPQQPEPEALRKVWRLQLGSVGIVIEILKEPGAADIDRSGHISWTEAVLLGVALALDSVAAGLGAAMAGFSPLQLPLAAAAGSLALMFAGSRGAQYLPFRLGGRWSMLHGLVLVALGLYRMVA